MTILVILCDTNSKFGQSRKIERIKKIVFDKRLSIHFCVFQDNVLRILKNVFRILINVKYDLK